MQPDLKSKRIIVVGAGAIGGICAGFIKKADFNVEVVCRNPEQAALIRSRGIHITGIRGDLLVSMPASTWER